MSLYLKYRPQTFDELSWQEFISTTLKNAVKEDKLVWAYLFTGPRGTGKTSSARIFARSINCTNKTDWNPCLTCDNCVSFWENKLIDIIEIDAASHTGVDNIRDIIEKAQFSPNKTKYKVYIIDEVHMLSKWAFNALLKILEEPPNHVKFILATTEINKVPETILSRCQRYDFKSIDDESVLKRLSYIAQNEDITIDEKSLAYITKNANGGLRNAINLFEQLIQWKNITYSDIIKNLWITEEDILTSFLVKLENKDMSIIADYEILIHSWKNLKIFFKDLLYYTKDKILSNIKSNAPYWNLIHILETLDEFYAKTKNTLDEKVTFLTAILKLISNETPHQQLVQMISVSEKTTSTSSAVKAEKPLVKKQEEAFSIEDIFWETPVKQTEKIAVEREVFNNTWNADIKETLIIALREIGVKWAVVMWVKSSRIEINRNDVTFHLATKFAYNGLNSPEVLTSLSVALWKVGIESPNVILKC